MQHHFASRGKMKQFRAASSLSSAWDRAIESLTCGAHYLVRLDDACATQNNKKWDAIEYVLDKLGIKPIVAVIPCNEDPSLRRGVKDENFWMRVKGWEKKGWTIALHGYRHVYHKVRKEDLVLPFHGRSEFAGLDLKTQSELLAKAYAEFSSHGIFPDVWIAPGHAFDANTLEALKRATPIRIVSDGIACHPFADDGLTFVPQQLWWPKRRLFGTWTICLHPETMTNDDIQSLEATLLQDRFRQKMISLPEALKHVRRKGLGTAIYARLFWLRWNLSHH
jgi:predicted deacetylase